MHLAALFTLGLVCVAAELTPEMTPNATSGSPAVNTSIPTANMSTAEYFHTSHEVVTTDHMSTSAGSGRDGAVIVTSVLPATKGPTKGPIKGPTKGPTKTTTTSNKKTSGENKNDRMGPQKSVDQTGIIIIAVIVVAGLLVAMVCCIRHKNKRRYSVDLRADEANVPLSVIVDPNEPDNTAGAHNGMQTEDSKESQDSGPAEDPQPKDSGPAEDPQPKDSGPVEDPKPKDSGPAEDPQPMAEQKAQAEDKVEAGKTPDAVATEESAAQLASGGQEVATDDEGIVSNKTSVESLKEPGENTASNTQTEASATDALI